MKYKIIYLPSYEHTVLSAHTCIETAKHFGVDIELFEGFLPDKAAPIINRMNMINIPKFMTKCMRPGVQGCFASHYTLWKECAEVDELYCILEHDVTMIAPMPKITLNSGDVLHLAYGNKETDEIFENDFVFHGMKQFKGAYSYIITPKAAKALVDYADNVCWMPADTLINDAVPGVKTKYYGKHIFRLESMFSLTNPEMNKRNGYVG